MAKKRIARDITAVATYHAQRGAEEHTVRGFGNFNSGSISDGSERGVSSGEVEAGRASARLANSSFFGRFMTIPTADKKRRR
ncbi:MAG TPA: hypothetical protein VKF36_20920 [Syntrophorhabdales bacterium]|nr:hypothetical protein [Syntrophorhabdales bacterium]